jgi:hypothetical protein
MEKGLLMFRWLFLATAKKNEREGFVVVDDFPSLLVTACRFAFNWIV